MGDSFNDPNQNRSGFDSQRNGARNNFRGGRGPGNRDSGGFRIRLSDNEMKAARSIQEAFNLRSTVAVLGFALRTLGEMLEEGKLETLITEYKERGPNRNNQENPLLSQKDNSTFKASKANPFARPAKPAQSNIEKEPEETYKTQSSEQTLELETLPIEVTDQNQAEDQTPSSVS